LHLHPTLQALALKGLQNAFPHLQFIITTHAPMIMSGVESNDMNIVYKLDYSHEKGYSIKETNTYGMDVSTITETVLDQLPRDMFINKLLIQLFEFIDNNKIYEAKNMLKYLKERFGDNLPDLAQAEAMLNFTIINDAEN